MLVYSLMFRQNFATIRGVQRGKGYLNMTFECANYLHVLIEFFLLWYFPDYKNKYISALLDIHRLQMSI
jgi:hypothetical protein